MFEYSPLSGIYNAALKLTEFVIPHNLLGDCARPPSEDKFVTRADESLPYFHSLTRAGQGRLCGDWYSELLKEARRKSPGKSMTQL